MIEDSEEKGSIIYIIIIQHRYRSTKLLTFDSSPRRGQVKVKYFKTNLWLLFQVVVTMKGLIFLLGSMIWLQA